MKYLSGLIMCLVSFAISFLGVIFILGLGYAMLIGDPGESVVLKIIAPILGTFGGAYSGKAAYRKYVPKGEEKILSQ